MFNLHSLSVHCKMMMPPLHQHICPAMSRVLIQNLPASGLHLCNSHGLRCWRFQDPQTFGPDVLQDAVYVQALLKCCLVILYLKPLC